MRVPPLGGSTEWFSSEPLGLAYLRRQEPHLAAWSRAYRDDRLIVTGAHTPESSFEHKIDGIRQAIAERGIDYPLAVDNDYEVWSAFDNRHWPALYFVY